MMLISYAQCYEDVLLYGALRDVREGFYIDVGAWHPEEHSVTKFFYENGWHGINIEPVEQWFKLLTADRPRDINLRVAASSKSGTLDYYWVKDTGLSTADTQYARRSARRGFETVALQVEARTLNEICAEFRVQEIHFLKIDAEGHELDVLRGIDLERYRPWILMIEAVETDSCASNFAAWEPLITGHRYDFVHDDGLNRYYAARERESVKAGFLTPANPACEGFQRFAELRLRAYVKAQAEQIEKLTQGKPAVAAATNAAANSPVAPSAGASDSPERGAAANPAKGRRTGGRTAPQSHRTGLRKRTAVWELLGRAGKGLLNIVSIRRIVARRFARTLYASGLLDSDFYAKSNADRWDGTVDPALHYLLVGAALGCDPHPLFRTSYYLGTSRGAASSGMNPLLYYLRQGAREMASPHPLFVPDFYLSRHADAAQGATTLLQHYLQHRRQPGFDPHPLFDTAYYLWQHPESWDWPGGPLAHYLEMGALPGFDPNPWFDGAYYLEHNPHVARSGVNPLLHYWQIGASEGCAPHPLFSGSAYRDRYPDVARSGMNPLAHYLHFGMREGRERQPAPAKSIRSPHPEAPRGAKAIAMQPRRAGLRFVLDFPNSFSGGQGVLRVESGSAVSFTGWCFHESLAVRSIVLRLGTAKFGGATGTARPDVSEYFSNFPGSRMSGFSIPVVLTLSGVREAVLGVELDDSSVVELPLGQVVVNRPLRAVPGSSDFTAGKLDTAWSSKRDRSVNHAAFTIASKNTTHMALAVRESFLEHNPGFDFFIVVMDMLCSPEELKVYGKLKSQGIRFIFYSEIRHLYLQEVASEMEVKFDSFTMNTNIKPTSFRYIADSGYTRIVYFDPDIMVMAPIDGMMAELDEHDIVLTPPFLSAMPESAPRKGENLFPDERDILLAATFNPGFLAIKVSEITLRMLSVWQSRLAEHGFLNPQAGPHTDQKWIESIPALFDKVKIFKDPGYNVGYGNLHERLPVRRGDTWVVGQRPLVCFHFSGLDLGNMEQISKRQNRYELSQFPSLEPLFDEYRKRLLEWGAEAFQKMPYYFDRLPGTDIRFPDFIRENHFQELIEKFPPIFLADQTVAQAVAEFLKSDVFGDGRLTRVAKWLWDIRTDVRKVYPQLQNPDSRAAFAAWLRDHASKELGIDPFWLEATNQSVRERCDAHSLGLNVIGFLAYHFGIAESAKAFLCGLWNSGIPYTTYGIAITGQDVDDRQQPRVFQGAQAERSLFKTNWFFVNADQLIDTIGNGQRNLFEGKRNIATFWWEFDDHLDSYRPAFDRLDEVVVFSEFVKTAVSKAAPAHVTVAKLPYPFLTRNLGWIGAISDRQAAGVRPQLGLSPDDFVFMFHFDMASISARKNPAGLISAFASAFAGRKDARLVLKVMNARAGQGALPELQAVADALKVKDQIVWITEDLDRGQLLSLLSASDAYVSLHRSEGLGLGMAEAMELSKPVIATRYGGNLEFMSDDNSMLIDYRLVPLDKDYLPYRKGWMWAAPELDHAVAAMRSLYENREQARRLGQIGKASLEQRFSAERFSGALYDLMLSWK